MALSWSVLLLYFIFLTVLAPLFLFFSFLNFFGVYIFSKMFNSVFKRRRSSVEFTLLKVCLNEGKVIFKILRFLIIRICGDFSIFRVEFKIRSKLNHHWKSGNAEWQFSSGMGLLNSAHTRSLTWDSNPELSVSRPNS